MKVSLSAKLSRMNSQPLEAKGGRLCLLSSYNSDFDELKE
jgi:hypothetical protein